MKRLEVVEGGDIGCGECGCVHRFQELRGTHTVPTVCSVLKNKHVISLCEEGLMSPLLSNQTLLEYSQ